MHHATSRTTHFTSQALVSAFLLRLRYRSAPAERPALRGALHAIYETLPPRRAMMRRAIGDEVLAMTCKPQSETRGNVVYVCASVSAVWCAMW